MKRFGTLSLVLLLCAGLLLTGCSGTAAAPRELALIPEGTRENDVASPDFQKMAETDALTLEVNPDTTAFRVTVKETGRVWSSTAESGEQEAYNAAFTLAYMATGSVAQYMNSYTDSVKKGQYEITPLDNGVKIRYSLGEVEPQYFAPAILTEERYLQFYDAMESGDQRFMRQLYSKIDLNNYEGEERKKTASKYPLAEDGPIYVLASNMQKSVKIKLDGALRSAGYTEADRALDAENGGELTVSAEPQFSVSLYLELEDGALRVRVPCEEIAWTEEFPLETIRLLPNFGRTDRETDGYFLLPDGSGSIMNFYNGKNNLQEYAVQIYGADRSIAAGETTFREQTAVFPLFGCALEGGNGYLAVIEDGDALAAVNAAPGDDAAPPSVCASFTVLQQAKIATLSTTENTDSYFVTHQAEAYDGEFRVAYHFLTGEDASYNGMAGLYRELLLGDRAPLDGGDSLPLYVNLLGETDIRKNVLGVNVRRQLTLTSFEDGRALVDSLLGKGMENLQVILSGCLNGGCRQGYLGKAEVSGQLGGKSGLTGLAGYLAEKGVSCALDAEVQYAYDKGLFDGLGNRQIARLLSRKQGAYYPADRAYFSADTEALPSYILNSAGIETSFASLTGLLGDTGLTGVSLRSVGREINSDYNEKREMERQTSLARLKEQVAALRESADNLILSTGIAPFAAQADSLLSLPLSSSNYDITDYSVPFTAMVLSGYVRYTGGRINLDFSDRNDYLRLLESGAAPYYLLCAENAEELRNTDFSDFYAIQYNYLEQTITDDYAWLSEALDGCWGQPITGHERLAEGVVQTTYAGGTRILINYNRFDVTLEDGRTIPAQQYIRERS